MPVCASVHVSAFLCTRPTVISLLVSPVHLSASIQSDLQLHGRHSDILHTHTHWQTAIHIDKNTHFKVLNISSIISKFNNIFIRFLNARKPHYRALIQSLLSAGNILMIDVQLMVAICHWWVLLFLCSLFPFLFVIEIIITVILVPQLRNDKWFVFKMKHD